MTTSRTGTASALLEVRLRDGTCWRGSEAQLRRAHPDWLPYARWAAVPYENHSASIHPEDMPPSTTDQQADEDEEDTLSGYPDERPRLAPPSTVRSLQRYRGPGAPAVAVHAGPPPPLLVRRASRHQPQPTRPAPDDGTVYEMPPAGGWQRRSTPPEPTPDGESRPKRRGRGRRPRVHPLLPLGVGMLLMLLLWTAGTRLVAWWQLHQDDMTYGRPRTYQTDAVVGHFDSAAHPSHFVAENLHGRVLIFELPGGDASRARVYVGPLLSGPGADLAPVTLAFPVIGGKVAMVVTVQDEIRLVYLNKDVKGVWQFVQQPPQQQQGSEARQAGGCPCLPGERSL